MDEWLDIIAIISHFNFWLLSSKLLDGWDHAFAIVSNTLTQSNRYFNV